MCPTELCAWVQLSTCPPKAVGKPLSELVRSAVASELHSWAALDPTSGVKEKVRADKTAVHHSPTVGTFDTCQRAFAVVVVVVGVVVGAAAAAAAGAMRLYHS